MGARGTGLLIVTFGVVVALVGLLVMSGALAWFGRLPGDLHIESGQTRVFIPITSMVIVSLVLTLLLNLARRWMG